MYRELGDAAYVVRTAWLYGAHGPNFIRTMIRLEQERSAVDVVDDQRGQPTWTVDVASQIIALVQADAPGASITRPVLVRQPGTGSPARSSVCSVPTRIGSGPSAAGSTRGQHPVPPTACSVTTPGRWPESNLPTTGARRYAGHSQRSAGAS